jgi:hypothetical protein
MAVRADQVLSKSRRDKDVTTNRSRQAFFIRWMRKLKKDPCNHSNDEDMALITCFIESIIAGVSIRNKDSIRAGTVKGYADQINKLHKLRGFQQPIFNNRDNAAFVLIKALKDEENIAKQRKPMLMASEIINMGNKSHKLSKEALVKDICIVVRQVCPRAAEYAQKTQTKADVHTYPSGKEVIKALCADRIKFYDKRGRRVLNPLRNRTKIENLSILWAIQKNRWHGELKWYSRDHDNPQLCLVEAFLRLIERAQLLGQPDNMPFSVYLNKRVKTVYLTGQTVTNFLRKIAKKLYPHMTEEELSYYSCHSFRAWAAVLLSEAGKDGDYIKI